MNKKIFENADGEMLIVVQKGSILITTELGRMTSKPNLIVVIPRGIKFKVDLLDCTECRGYFAEVFNGHFELPERGVIGANNLASEIDFEIPQAY